MKKFFQKGILMPLVFMGVVGILITAAGIIFRQSFLRILPLYLSLIIGFLQSKVSRFAPLLGGINSLLYAAVYFYYGLYASFVYAILISCPLQIITFINWRKRAYGQSVRFKIMSAKQRIFIGATFVGCWLILYVILSTLGSSYLLFDNTTTLFGILVTVLTMLAYIEYTYLIIPSCLCSVLLYFVMIRENPEQVTYLIFAIYSLICNIRGAIYAHKLYTEQKKNS